MCVSPIVLRRAPTPAHPTGLVSVPCGKCYECLKRRRENWAQRLYSEMDSHLYSCWITLTYDDEHIGPLYVSEANDFTLCKKDLQDFIKRLRITIDRHPRRYMRDGNSVDVRYFAAGEYGEKFGRPHYHVILFGISPYNCDVYKLLRDTWEFGLPHIDELSLASIRYTCKYLLKSSADSARAFLEPPFNLQSRRPPIGWQFIEKERRRLSSKSTDEQLKTSYFHYYGGQKAAYCRYYSDKLFLKDDPIKSVRRKHIERAGDKKEQEWLLRHAAASDAAFRNKFEAQKAASAKLSKFREGSLFR